jgi:hypothetical protein
MKQGIEWNLKLKKFRNKFGFTVLKKIQQASKTIIFFSKCTFEMLKGIVKMKVCALALIR